jgi:hypothetical protein
LSLRTRTLEPVSFDWVASTSDFLRGGLLLAGFFAGIESRRRLSSAPAALGQQRIAASRRRKRMLRMSSIFVLICACTIALPARAQSQSQSPATPQAAAPAAKPADVATPDAILAAVYDVISGPPAPRDWDRFNSLFAPGARLIPIGPKKDSTGIGIYSMSPQDYATRAGSYFVKNGFVEREAFRKAERYGDIMQVFSTYESRHDAKDEKPFARGINSFQLYFDGTRWWVVTIMWEEETAANPIPKEFLPPAK